MFFFIIKCKGEKNINEIIEKPSETNIITGKTKPSGPVLHDYIPPAVFSNPDINEFTLHDIVTKFKIHLLHEPT